jgi:hypothetical protein
MERGKFWRKAFAFFMALVGLAGPLLKRWCKYTPGVLKHLEI